jgi:hypothetical protein
MATYSEAFQAKTKLKMNLSNYFWYLGTDIIIQNDDYCLVIHSKSPNYPFAKINTYDKVKVTYQFAKENSNPT